MDTVKCLVAKGVRADIEDCDGVVIHKSTTENRHKLVPHQRSCIYHFYIQIIQSQISLCANNYCLYC